MTLGLLGGTFDPIHRGHLDVARAAQAALSIDQVWIVPARVPPHRATPTASAAHRFAMAALAVVGDPTLRVSDLEMDHAGPSYTIDTLNRAQALRPDAAGAICFIAGADAFADIRTWRAYAELLDRAHFAVVSRPGFPARRLRDVLPDLAERMIDAPCAQPSSPGIFLVDAPTADVSSTAIRAALGAGARVDTQVPPAVTVYAARHELYVTDRSESAHE